MESTSKDQPTNDRPANDRPTRGRNRSRGSAGARARGEPREQELDLLTAALIGLAIGAGATLLIRRGPTGRRPLTTGMLAAGRGARWAGEAGYDGARVAGLAAARGARRGFERGGELLEELPLGEIGGNVREFLDAAREAVEDTVKDEVRDLRRAVRRRRKQLGL